MFFTLSLFLSFSVTSPPARQFARCSYPLSRSPICAAASSQDVRPHDKPAGKVVKTRCGDGNLVIAKGPIQAHAATGCLGRGTLGLGEWGMELTSRKRNTCLWTMTEMSCIMPFIVRKPWLFFLLPVYRYASPTQPPPLLFSLHDIPYSPWVMKLGLSALSHLAKMNPTRCLCHAR